MFSIVFYFYYSIRFLYSKIKLFLVFRKIIIHILMLIMEKEIVFHICSILFSKKKCIRCLTFWDVLRIFIRNRLTLTQSRRELFPFCMLKHQHNNRSVSVFLDLLPTHVTPFYCLFQINIKLHSYLRLFVRFIIIIFYL